MDADYLLTEIDTDFQQFLGDTNETTHRFSSTLSAYQKNYTQKKALSLNLDFRVVDQDWSGFIIEISRRPAVENESEKLPNSEPPTQSTPNVISDKIKSDIDEIFTRLRNVAHSHTFSRKLCTYREYIEEKAAKRNFLVTELQEGVLQVKNTRKPNEIKDSFFIEPSNKTTTALNDFFQLPNDSVPQNLQPRQLLKFSYGSLRNVPAAMVPRHIAESRKRLPVFTRRAEIIQTINKHRVTIISSDTGSGKTTQIPQYILEDARDRNAKCRVICTEPRRIATVSVAERVARERGEPVGCSVGYYIRFEKKFKASTNLIYAPSGIVLQTLDRDLTVLNEITHVVLDEVHERDELSDFLMLTLKMALAKLPHLKLILMSATMNTDKFRQFFENSALLSIPGQGFEIQFKYLAVKRKKEVPEELRGRFDALMDDYAAEEQAFTELARYFVEVPEWVDYQHSKTGMTAIMIAASLGDYETVVGLFKLKTNLKLTCNSGNTSLSYAHQSGRKKVVNFLMAVSGMVATLSSKTFIIIEDTIRNIIANTERGSILVFLPGYSEIMHCKATIENSEQEPPLDPNSYRIFVLHGGMDMRGQNEVFKPLHGVRKIILATNIAESGITVDGLDFVIDCCRARQKFYDPVTKGARLDLVWISKQNAIQRAGRTGRTGPGTCFRLCTREQYDSLEDGRRPEILHVPLESLCLFSKMFAPAGVKIEEYLSGALDPPDLQAIRIAVENLKTMGALDGGEGLTDLGHCLTQLSVEPRFGKMLVYAVIFKCLEPILTIVAVLSYKSPFELPANSDRIAEIIENRRLLVNGIASHHYRLIKLFNMWSVSGNQREVCRKYGLGQYVLEFVSKIRGQLMGQLRTMGLLEGNDFNRFAASWPMVKAVFGSGLYPYVGCPVDAHYFRTKQIKFDVDSVSLELKKKRGMWVLYSALDSSFEKQMSVICGTFVTPLNAILMSMGGEMVKNDDDGMGEESYMQKDDWIAIETNNEQVFGFNRALREFIEKTIKYGPSWSRYGEDLLKTLEFILRAEDERYEFKQPDDIYVNY